MNEGISRRNFIGGAALGGAALALGALAGCAPQGDKPTGSEGAWDAEVDLLVCGCGGAGMACAVEAKDNGVENVLIIEKGDQIGGTTAMSQGMIAGWDTQLQKSQGVELTYDAMYANLMNNASYHLDPALTKITVENSGKTIDWLIDRVGVKFTDQIDIYYGPLQMMHNVDGAGGGFVTAFTACLDQLGVEIQKGTKLVEVLLDAEGKTEGAVVEAKGKTQRIKARAIMIATGGYAYNAELAARFDPEKAGTFGIGHPNCEGEGLVAASNAGALLSHTNDMMCVVKDYTIMSEHDGTSASANLDGFTNLPNMILVGADGKRFVDEGKKGVMSQDLNGPIFDKIHRDGMGYVWEISDEATVAAAGGKVKRGEGLEYIKGADATELAANMGVDAAALAETIEAYNAAVDSGVDREIGGFPTAKLEAPFLAVPVVPCEIITYGGVARTEQGEVIRADGEVMPGLFVGGEASCNSAYMGFTLSNCFTWGRIGAQSAAAYLKA